MSDTQVTELAGKHFLISQLLAGGVGVAEPVLDHCIDLIAYIDRVGDASSFLACPIQLKANEGARFGVHKKYERFPSLLMVFAWNVSTPTPELYALTYAEVVALLEQRGHTETRSWKELGGYSLIVNDVWRKLLEPYRMTPSLWGSKIRSVIHSEELVTT